MKIGSGIQKCRQVVRLPFQSTFKVHAKFHVLLTVLFMLFQNHAISINSKCKFKDAICAIGELGVRFRFRLGCYYAIFTPRAWARDTSD